LCLEVHINQVAALLCVARPSLVGLQATPVKTPPSKMPDLSETPRNLGVFPFYPFIAMGRDSAVGVVTRYGLDGGWIESRGWGGGVDGPGIESRWGWTVRESKPGGAKIFRTRPDRPWGPPSLLDNGYRVFPGGKMRPGRGVDHPPPSSAEVKERDLYLCSTFGPSWPLVAPYLVNFNIYRCC
jgi:hypothetical protein